MLELVSPALQLTAAAVLTALVSMVVCYRHSHHKQSKSSEVAGVTRPSKATCTTAAENPPESPAPFDSLASSYDKTFCETTVGSMLRRETWKVLEQAFCSPSTSSSNCDNVIIELSCGTGEDAMWLAAKHVHILATDYSDGMIDRARSKCRSCSAIAKEDQPIFQRLDMKTFDASSLGRRKFSGAFSNFGGLNNVGPDEIQHCAKALAMMLSPGAKVVVVVMGRFCAYETIYWLLRGNFRKAFRRMRSSEVQGITATVAKKKHTVYFHSMSTVEAAFSNTLAFRRVQRRAIGLLLPPSLWSKSASRKVPPAMLSVLYSIDMLLGRIWPFIYMGDHYLIEFERAVAVPAETERK